MKTAELTEVERTILVGILRDYQRLEPELTDLEVRQLGWSAGQEYLEFHDELCGVQIRHARWAGVDGVSDATQKQYQRALKKLADKGLIKRVRGVLYGAPAGRVTHVQLTSDGRKLAESLTEG